MQHPSLNQRSQRPSPNPRPDPEPSHSPTDLKPLDLTSLPFKPTFPLHLSNGLDPSRGWALWVVVEVVGVV